MILCRFTSPNGVAGQSFMPGSHATDLILSAIMYEIRSLCLIALKVYNLLEDRYYSRISNPQRFPGTSPVKLLHGVESISRPVAGGLSLPADTVPQPTD